LNPPAKSDGLVGLIRVERVGEKNSSATADQKRNNEGHEHYSCKTIRFWRRFVSGPLR
jgi:hypothetical protein